MTEGLLAEVMVVKARLVAGDPSVLTADRVCVIWALQVSLSRAVSETNEPCRKPAPFGKGRARMPNVERPEFRRTRNQQSVHKPRISAGQRDSAGLAAMVGLAVMSENE